MHTLKLSGVVMILLHCACSQAQPACENFHPHYSPDNTQIIFDGIRDTTHAIIIADLSVGKEETIFDGPYRDAHPTWSPDGKTVVFQSQRNENWFTVDLWKKDLTSKNPVRLTQMEGFAGVPAYSPDGKKILFQFKPARNEDEYLKNKWHLWSMNIDGSSQDQLTFGNYNCQVPSYSNDGTRITYYSDESGDDEIYTMNADGTDQRRLTTHPEADNAPSFSPDGKTIVFKSTREGPREVYIMNADGSEVRRLTFGQDSHGAPKFSKDGKKVLFHSSASGTGRILTLDIATGVVTPLIECRIR